VIPPPPLSADVIAYIQAMHAQFVTTGRAGHFGIRWHYAKGGEIAFAEMESAKDRIDFAPLTSTSK